jgi:hypothetical protein
LIHRRHYGECASASAHVHGDLNRRDPTDRFFVESSIKITGEGTGNSQSCAVSFRREPITVNSGDLTFAVEVIKDITIRAHAETGSGYGNLGKTAWKRCTLTAQLEKFAH